MAVALRVTFTGQERLQRALSKMRKPELDKPVSRFLLSAAFAVLKDATENQIIRGGSFGGQQSPPHPSRVTSRTGELRRSLGVSRGLDRSGLPGYIEFGSDLVYAQIHELGLGRYPKRAFLVPALERVSVRFEEMLAREIEKELPA